MPNDNAAKSYIETVMARADAVKPLIERGLNSNGREYQLAQGCIPVCLDSQTLAKMLLRAIEALEKVHKEADQRAFTAQIGSDMEHYAARWADATHGALTDINALATKGSQ